MYISFFFRSFGMFLCLLLLFNWVQVVLCLLMALFAFVIAQNDVDIVTEIENENVFVVRKILCVSMAGGGFLLVGIYGFFVIPHPPFPPNPITLTPLSSSIALVTLIIAMLRDCFARRTWRKYCSFTNKPMEMENNLLSRNILVVALLGGFGSLIGWLHAFNFECNVDALLAISSGLACVFAMLLFQYMICVYLNFVFQFKS